jgi:hypothetical protein
MFRSTWLDILTVLLMTKVINNLATFRNQLQFYRLSKYQGMMHKQYSHKKQVKLRSQVKSMRH